MSALSKHGRAAACVVLLLTSACGSVATKEDPARTSEKVDTGTAQKGTAQKGTGPKGTVAKPVANMAVSPPGKLTAPLLSSDVLVFSRNTLDKTTIANIKKIKGIQAVEPISMAQFFVDDQEVTYAAVNPATFRRYSPPGTAQTEGVWDRVADGEIAVEPKIGKKLQRKGGYLPLGNEAAAKTIHIGAYAQILDPTKARRIDAVVNEKWVKRLGMRKDNALIIAMDDTSPQSIRKQLKKYAGTKASVQILGPDFDLGLQTALLTGGSVSKAVGTFNYTANANGTVNPDPAWVRAKITTEVMPIIGRVTGNRVMLPQLRAALGEVVARGLSKSIYHYDGCYVPRFIAGSHSLSFHTFGTAIDLNASDNYRGIAGKMDRQVVAIFKRWGFAWGGDWRYTDPMHFELATLKKAVG